MLMWIDDWLNRITMYRLVVWTLGSYLAIAAGLGALGWLPYSPLAIASSVVVVVVVGWLVQQHFARVWNTPTNVESWLISALILALIITPLRSAHDLPFLFWATVWTIASKFMVSWQRQHLLNPVGFGIVLTSFSLGTAATWWVGTLVMLPVVAVGGFLIVRKIRRTALTLGFLSVALGVSVAAGLFAHTPLATILQHVIVHSPLVFFATIMLTEPATTPPRINQQIIYGAFTGLLFAPQFHLGSLFFSPEQALLVGNVYSWLVSPKARLLLTFKERIQLAPDIDDLIFTTDRPLEYAAGQYLEWTLPHAHPDRRGNRRSFTIASAPSKRELRIGVKFSDQSSSFKLALSALKPGDQLLAGQLAGDFTLPKDPTEKLAFIAGGIGVTPFRSMIEELTLKQGRRDMVLFYSVKTPDQLVYRDVFDRAAVQIGLKPTYVVSDRAAAKAARWTGPVGRLSVATIRTDIPDFHERTFYLSGPHAMVTAFEATLKQLRVPRQQIKTDYFPGFA